MLAGLVAVPPPAYAAPGEKLHASRTVIGPNGVKHTRYDRTYQGLPVLGGDVITHGDQAPESRTLSTLTTLSTTPQVSGPAATAIAVKSFPFKPSGSPQLVIEGIGDTAAARVPALAWDVLVTGTRPDGLPTALHVLVDAATGAIRTTYDDVQADTGHGFHSGDVPLTTAPSGTSRILRDPTRGNFGTYDVDTQRYFTDSDGDWADGRPSNAATDAVDVQWGAAVTYDFYKQTFGYTLVQNSEFSDGPSTLNAGVHEGSRLSNAYWSEQCHCMRFGDGNGVTTNPYTSLDVVAHEATHSVISRTAKLWYSGESGGLNEATSDIVGNLVEFFAANPADPPDYLVGEKVWKAAPLRYMDRPSKDGVSADCWSPTVGSLNVHRSSGVGNHAFFLLANGSGTSAWGDSPTCDGSTVTGIGRDTAARLWFHALDTQWTSSTNYAGARTGMLAAATELYGECGTEYRAVQAAWSAVAVTAVDQPCP
ncbi:Zn-dependent metalloprotease [Nonomuraea solani]|uniref:Neutral metalloproteinase n=2 Tax=Nonomuraea solani TaxID=1144553 RepID=A0A1H6EIK4_9ACTN|nr:Zn-dependent metalloprotease [Nonomuraea solani]